MSIRQPGNFQPHGGESRFHTVSPDQWIQSSISSDSRLIGCMMVALSDTYSSA